MGGETIKPSQLLAKVAPDLLPDALPTDPRYPAWPDDEGLWVTAARLVDGGRSVVLLLAENTWPPDHHEPEASAWLIVRVRPEDESVELLARGERADGDHLAIAL